MIDKNKIKVWWEKKEIPDEYKARVKDKDMLYGEWITNDERVEKITFIGMADATIKLMNLGATIRFKDGTTHIWAIKPPFKTKRNANQVAEFLTRYYQTIKPKTEL